MVISIKICIIVQHHLKFFYMYYYTNEETLHLHPLVKDTINAGSVILNSTRPSSNFETQWKHVRVERDFFVFYDLKGDETCTDAEKRVRKELGSHNKEPIVCN